MDINDYCESVGGELTGWKTKLSGIIQRTESLTGSDKQNVEPMLAELKDMMDDLDERIAALARECPTEWGSEKSEIDDKMSQVTHKWKEVYGVMGEKEYGLGGA
jgi:hypothetical protein